MRYGWKTWPLIGAVLLLAACPLAQGAEPKDMAAAMPADTLMYVGWSDWYAADSPDIRMIRQLTENMDVLEELLDDDEAAEIVTALLKAMVPAYTGSVGIGLLDVAVGEDGPSFHVALVAKAGDQVSGYTNAIATFLETVNAEDDVEPASVSGVSLKRLQPPHAPDAFLWGMHRGHFILAFGEAAAAKVIACLNGTAPTLADSEELRFDRQKVAAKFDTYHFCLFVNVQRAVERGKAFATAMMGELPPMVQQVLDETGISSVRSKYVHVDEIDHMPRTMMFAHVVGPRTGLLTLWEQELLTDDDLKIVPQDAYWLQVNNFDLHKCWTETMRVVTALVPEAGSMVDGAMAMAREVVGFSPTEDLLPVFGDTWAIYDAPAHGGLLGTGTVLAVEMRNPEALQGMLSRSLMLLSTILEEEEDVVVKQCSMQHEGRTIHYVMLPGLPSPVAPAWCFAEGRFVLALYPQTVATALRQIDPKTRGPSILDNPDYQAARAHLPKDVLGVGYADSKCFARILYPIMTGMQTMGVSMLAKCGVEMDLEIMPPLPVQLAKVANYVGTSSTDRDGVLCANVGYGMPMTALIGAAAMGTSVMLPALSDARHQAKSVTSAAHLKQIGMGCHMWANDHDERYPDNLEQLIDEGILSYDVLASPLAPDDPEPYILIGGQTGGDDWRNIQAYERVRDDIGTWVLFLDGHVEFMDLMRFKRELAATYERLNRSDELPPAFRP